jgi:hypothetical protein
MATEHVLRLRITKAAEAAARANARQDARAYAAAKQAYDTADKALRELEAARNEKAIHELEMSALPCRGGAVLSPAKIAKSGVPVEVLQGRGWESDNRGGMWLPPELPRLAAVPPPEDEAG